MLALLAGLLFAHGLPCATAITTGSHESSAASVTTEVGAGLGSPAANGMSQQPVAAHAASAAAAVAVLNIAAHGPNDFGDVLVACLVLILGTVAAAVRLRATRPRLVEPAAVRRVRAAPQATALRPRCLAELCLLRI